MQLQFNMQSSKAAVSTSQVKIKAASLKLDLEVKKKSPTSLHIGQRLSSWCRIKEVSRKLVYLALGHKFLL